MSALDISSITWDQDCSHGSTDTKSHAHSNVTSGEKQICSRACFLISPLSVCLAWHLMQALMLLPRLDKMVFFLLLFHRAPRGRVFVCFALMFATVKVCNIWSLTLPRSAPSLRLLLPSGGSLTWDRKYKTCLIFDKAGKESGSESSISGRKRRWNHPSTSSLLQTTVNDAQALHQPRHSGPL